MINNPTYITSFASISALGTTAEEVWESYLKKESLINPNQSKNGKLLTADLTIDQEQILIKLLKGHKRYKSIDKTVLLALFATKQAFDNSNWNHKHTIGINIGSSRGATELFEKYHSKFLNNQTVSPLTSPNTTLGNISTWIANDLQVQGPVISHSITCSTALHSVLNGIAWLNSGMSKQFIVGGSEAANTSFTVAQMQALKIYTTLDSDNYPCQSLKFNKIKNTMVLGEGAAVFCLEKNTEKYEAKIIGYGYGTEIVNHNVSISVNADCFQKSMAMALKNSSYKAIDVIVMHAPGTIKGDLSEFNAIQSVFGENLPCLTSNKWKIGHSLGASGALSLEMAILMLKHQKLIESPFYKNKNIPKTLKTILVNAVGFGGNAVSIIIER